MVDWSQCYTMDLLKKTSPDQLQDQLPDIARELLCGTRLNINGHLFRLMEIEFYIHNDKHPDIFAHCFDDQKNHCQWYFHKASNKEHAYKGGTFKGLDIACGGQNCYGGILIRSVSDLKTGKVIEGPCRLVNKILELTECKNIKELVCEKMNGDLNVNGKVLSLEPHNHEETEIFASPRIGLTLKKKDHLALRKHYICQLYRFLIYPTKISKGSKMTSYIAIHSKPTSLIEKYLPVKSKQIDEIEKSIANMMKSKIDYGIDLNDIQRLELYFGIKDN